MKFPIPLKDKLTDEQISVVVKTASDMSIQFNSAQTMFCEPTARAFMAMATAGKAGANLGDGLIELVADMIRENGKKVLTAEAVGEMPFSVFDVLKTVAEEYLVWREKEFKAREKKR